MKTGHNSKEKVALERFFKGLQVKEAKDNLLIIPLKRDLKGAVRADPTRCVLARACNRLFGSTAAVVFKRFAYIDLMSDKGVRVVWRFELNHSTWEAIVRFDKTGEFPLHGFTFRAPAKSRTLEYMRKYEAKRRAAVIRGDAVRRRGPKTPRGNGITLEGIRDGRGQVHFNEKEKAA